jgi:hypothetical protein
MYTGCAHLAAGLCCGFSGLGSGMAIGIAGNASVHACGVYETDGQKPRSSEGVYHRPRTDKKRAGGGDKLFIGMVRVNQFLFLHKNKTYSISTLHMYRF